MDNIESQKRHSLTLDERAEGIMSGVTEVAGYGDEELALVTNSGKLTIKGKGLKIVKFNSADGSLRFTGKVDSVRYDGEKLPLLRRIFR